MERGDLARPRREVFGSSALTRSSIAWPRGAALVGERQRLARGDPDLLAHEIEAGDQLGHRVLDLEPRVHLHEVELAVGVEQVLHRADVGVADRLDRRTDAAVSFARVSSGSADATAPPRCTFW